MLIAQRARCYRYLRASQKYHLSHHLSWVLDEFCDICHISHKFFCLHSFFFYAMLKTVLIMAGGSGERFWPLSRRTKPKQLLKLTAPDKTMLEQAIDRIAPLVPHEHIFIVTSELLQPVIREALKELPPENIIAEPAKRNTAPCIALACAFIAERYATTHSPDRIAMAVLTADSHIANADIFRTAVATAFDHVEKHDALVTFGLKPTRPATGFGYIKAQGDTHVPAHQERSAVEAITVRPVASFHEKPNEETAKAFLADGHYYWNSGMFIWRLDTVMRGLTECLPEVGIKLETLRAQLRGQTHIVFRGAAPSIDTTFSAFPDISIDYGLMERASNVAMITAEFDWDDIGSYDALERSFGADDKHNVLIGDAVVMDSQNCIVINDAGINTMSVGVIGMDDIVVVATVDGILVCPKARVQDVKKVVAVLKEKHGERFI
jgi:mannose-1-phosphate guanylyltransferase